MAGTWFRRYARFSYLPTTWQGSATIGVMGLVAIPAGITWLSLADTRPTVASLAGAIAVAAALAGHAIVLWKMDWNYRRP